MVLFLEHSLKIFKKLTVSKTVHFAMPVAFFMEPCNAKLKIGKQTNQGPKSLLCFFIPEIPEILQVCLPLRCRGQLYWSFRVFPLWCTSSTATATDSFTVYCEHLRTDWIFLCQKCSWNIMKSGVLFSFHFPFPLIGLGIASLQALLEKFNRPLLDNDGAFTPQDENNLNIDL